MNKRVNVIYTKKLALQFNTNLVESKFNHINALQLDVILLFLLFAQKSGLCSDDYFILKFDTFIKYFHYASEKSAYNTFLKLFNDKTRYSVSYCKDYSEWNIMPIFSFINYTNKAYMVRFTPAFLRYCSEDFRKQYVKLDQVFKLKTLYSKHLFLMCKRFDYTTHRFCDTDIEIFKYKLNVPSSYSYDSLKKCILTPSMKDISRNTELKVEYEVKELHAKGGKVPVKIEFHLRNKKKGKAQSEEKTIFDD